MIAVGCGAAAFRTAIFVWTIAWELAAAASGFLVDLMSSVLRPNCQTMRRAINRKQDWSLRGPEEWNSGELALILEVQIARHDCRGCEGRAARNLNRRREQSIVRARSIEPGQRGPRGSAHAATREHGFDLFEAERRRLAARGAGIR